MAEVRGAGANDPGDTMGQANLSGSEFVSIPSSDELSSNVVGLDIYNNENNNIGQIKDIAINAHGRTQALICRSVASSVWANTMSRSVLRMSRSATTTPIRNGTQQ